MSGGGRLNVTLLDGKNIGISNNEQYFIVAQMPDGAAPKVASLKTDAATKENFSKWNKMAIVDFGQPITSDMQIRCVLMEYGRIKDKPVGEGVFDCAELLAGGAHVVHRVILAPTQGGANQAMCDVSLDLSWDGAVPDYVQQNSTGGGGATMAAPTAAGGGGAGLVVGPGGVVTAKQQPGLPPCDGRTFSVRVMIRKAKNLQSENDNQLFDPLVCVSIGDETQKTDYQKKTNEPIFDEELMFMVKADSQFWSLPINTKVMHHRIGLPNDEIGTTQMEMQSVYRCNNHVMAHKWFILRKGGMSTQIMGFLKMTIMVLDALHDQIPEMEDDVEDGEESEDALIRNLVNTPGAQFEEVYLRCELLRAVGIPQMDGVLGGGKADPFVKLSYGMKTTRTSHLSSTFTPEWNTAVMLPIQKPALIDRMLVQLYDYDGIGKDKIIGTTRLSVDTMKALAGEIVGKGEEGLPRQYAKFLNFYGCPRSFYKDNLLSGLTKPKYFDAMDKGLKEGVDYRGRLLCRFTGSRDKNCAKEGVSIMPRTATLHFTVAVQALQFSMLKRDTYTFQVSCGNGEGQPPAVCKVPKRAEDMRGAANGLGSVFFGEEIRLEQQLEVVLPEPYVDAPSDFRSFVYQQIPDIFIHIVADKNIYAVYRVKVTDVMGKDEAILICDTMRVMKDPEKADDGEPPTDPLAQFFVGMILKKVEPGRAPDGAAKNPEAMERLNITPKERALLPTSDNIRFKAISLGEPDKYVVECCVHRGVNFPVGDPNGLSDPFVRISWANAAAQTGVQIETLNPTFEELVLLRADTRQPFTNIIVELWDWDFIGSNSFLAKAVVPCRYGVQEAGEKIWLSNFTDNRGKSVEAKLLVSFEIRKDVGQKYAETSFQKKPGRSDTYRGFEIPEKKRLALCPHAITVSCLTLRKMRPFRMLDVKHSQVTVSIGNTSIEFEKKKGVNPDVNQTKSLVLDLPENPEFWPNLSVAVFDHRQLGSKPRIGVASVPLIAINDEGNGRRTVENLFDPATKKAKKEAAELLVKERIAAITRWKHEAFGDATDMLASQSSVMSPMNTESDLTASYSMAIRQRDAERAKKDKKSKKKSRQSGADETVGEFEEIEMEDSSNELSEAEVALAVIKSNQDKLFEDRADKAREDEVAKHDKNRIAKPSDIPWFERFDADDTIEEKDFIVSRLGKVHDYLCKHDKVKAFKGAGEGTAEAYFGPFVDEGLRIQLLRGFTKTASKAGEVALDISIEVSKGSKPRAPDDGPIAAVKMDNRQGAKFEMRAYLISCRHLSAVDHSMSGSSSDPYIVLTLNSGADGDKGEKGKKINLKEFRKDKTLNPDYYLVQQMPGELPKHANLLVEVYDYNDILSDKLIGFTNISLEDRWYSCRGYQEKRDYMEPGAYTEKRQLRDETGQIQGTIELWIDMFPAASVPAPIDITPPPPIPMELRTIVWAARDVVLEDMSLSGEAMVDIYVRAWINGLRHDMQSTDVHYRSLDGSGTFNWRMNFQFLFDPRSRKIMPLAKKAKSIANWFRIRREQKKFDPIVKVQIFDNNLLPGTDNFIGESSLNLLKLRPVNNNRNKFSLLAEILGDMKDVAKTFLCCSCCKKKPTIKDLSLEQRQEMAVKEFEEDCIARQKMFDDEADERVMKLRALKGVYTEDQLAAFRVKFVNEARAKAQVNAFEPFLPSARAKQKATGKHLKAVQELPPMSETAKYWFTARGPKGSGRVGDVQISFQLVRLEALEKDDKLVAGRGRAEPQALPDPNRPDTSFFWLTSPFKAATHILWTRFKWYILGALALLLLGLFIYVFITEGIQVRAQKFFE